MGVEIRPIEFDEREPFLSAVIRTFGGDPDPDELERFFGVMDRSRTVAAFDGDEIVGTAGAFSMDIAVPGGTLPMGGTTIVTVRPTHRRRGVLRAMMAAHLDDVRSRNEPLAGLWASEAPIYGRFGYGPSAERYVLSIDTRTTGGLVSETTGTVSIVDVDQARRVVPPIYEAVRSDTPGMLHRTEAWWEARVFHDPERWREGASKRRWAVYRETDGTPSGYVAYRQKQHWEREHADSTVKVIGVVATTPHAHRALWSFLLSMDLFPNVEYWNLPIDDPLPWLLQNRRAVHRTRYDSLWLKLMDVPAALAARAYLETGRIVIEVTHTDAKPEVVELQTSPEDVTCTPSSAPADVTLSDADLGALYLGGQRALGLARAGRVHGSPDAITALDELFAWPRAPWCPEVF